jgi:hypothetical protein
MRDRVAIGVALGMALAFGCDPADRPDDLPPDSGPTCPAGFVATPGRSCIPRLPEGDCPPGTMAVPGEHACVPVGWTDCSDGFTPHPSGHGCVDVLPPLPCTGATREAIGQLSCVPIGDCDAPFPPPDATLFVDRRFPADRLDETHHRSIYEAYQAAPPGAVIAVESGTYHDVNTIRRDVRIVGRCAAEVVMEAVVDAYAFGVADGADFFVSGITFRRYVNTILVDADSSATLEDVVIEGARGTGPKSQLGGALRLVRSVVRDTEPFEAEWGMGVTAVAGGRLEVVDSVIRGSHAAGVLASADDSQEASEVHIRRSVIAETHLEAESGNAFGVLVAGHARVDVEDGVIARAGRAGAIVSGPGAQLAARRTVLRDTYGAGDPGGVVGLVTQDGARLELTEVQVQDNPGGILVMNPGTRGVLRQVTVQGSHALPPTRGDGITIAYGATAIFESVASVENHQVGLYIGVGGAEVTGRDLLVAETVPNEDGVRRGVSVEDGVLRLERGAIRSNGALGLFVGGPTGAAILERVLIDDAPVGLIGGERLYGYGVLTRYQGRLELDGSIIRGAEGVGLTFSDASGTVRRTLITQNGTAIHAQDGSRVQETLATPEPLPDGLVAVGTDVVFIGNDARLGAGALPLPAGVLP